MERVRQEIQSFDVSQHILELVYRGLIESILSFNIVTWYGNVNMKNRAKLARIVNIATKLIGREQNQLSHVYNVALKRKAIKIFHDDTHPLNAAFHIILPSGRHLTVPLARKNLWKKSLIPSAILMLNSRLDMIAHKSFRQM